MDEFVAGIELHNFWSLFTDPNRKWQNVAQKYKYLFKPEWVIVTKSVCFDRQIHSFEMGDANIHHTRLNLGLSHLKAHLFTYNLIPSPICGCGIEAETTEHYIIRCPTFGVARIEMYHTMIGILGNNLLATLRKDSDIVNLFLYGHNDLSYDKNRLIFKMAQTYINASERFSSTSLQ